MCGIAGFVNRKDTHDAEEVIQKMTSLLSHRGPDGSNAWLSADRQAAFGHARLSVIDLAGGGQPMVSADGHLVITFNGEIYNYKRLRAELARLNYNFQTNSDTEVILSAYAAWGESCLARFDGMFAFAIFDIAKGRLFIARDRVGIKPLYYSAKGPFFLFASEPKGVLAAGTTPVLNYHKLVDFFVYGYPLLSETFFDGINELPPGTWLAVEKGGAISRGRYWQWRRETVQDSCSAILEKTKRALLTSLEDHLVSDVPVAAFMSGGIDSTLLVALMVRELGVSPDTFNMKFHEASYDESRDARTVASTLGVRHHEIEISKFDLDLVHSVIDQFDQPFGDSSAIPTYLLSRAVRQEFKVVISGDAGDEMFGGYPRFRHVQTAKRIGATPAPVLDLLSALSESTRRLLPERFRQSQRLLRASRARGVTRLRNISCYNSLEEVQKILKPETWEKVSSYLPERAYSSDMVGASGTTDLMDMTIALTLPGDYLRKVDFMSAANGLEVRVPYLGNQVLDCSSKIPVSHHFSNRENKVLLRSLARKYLPRSILERPKTGFGVPLDSWMGQDVRAEIRDMLTNRNSSRIFALLRPEWIIATMDAFVSGRWDKARWSRFMVYQHAYFLWTLERWLMKWNPAL